MCWCQTQLLLEEFENIIENKPLFSQACLAVDFHS